jgi:hypothetical protein
LFSFYYAEVPEAAEAAEAAQETELIVVLVLAGFVERVLKQMNMRMIVEIGIYVMFILQITNVM